MINPEREQWRVLSSLFLFLVKGYDATWRDILGYAEALKGCVTSGARFELKLRFGTAECQTRGSAEEKQGRKKRKKKNPFIHIPASFHPPPNPPAPIPVSLYFPPPLNFSPIQSFAIISFVPSIPLVFQCFLLLPCASVPSVSAPQRPR